MAQDHIGGYTKLIAIAGSSVGANTTAYTSGDLLGGKLTLTDAGRKNLGTVVVLSATITDLDKQDLALDVVIFSSDPDGTTFTNNAALDVADADLAKIVGVIKIATTDYHDFNDNSVAVVRNLGIACQADSSGDLYAAIVARGAPTHTANGLGITFGLLQD